MILNNSIIIITGSTCVGKTDFAIELAEKVSGEIINIDVGQFYFPLTIGTAKPDWKNETIPHHFFDILDSPKDLTVFEYRQLLIPKLNEIFQKNKTPILVGGSGFYIQSLLFPPTVKNAPNKFNINENQKIDNNWEKLFSIDPKRAEQINKNDVYRIDRALQIWQTTGKLPSDYVPEYNPPSAYSLYILERERSELYQRINKRVYKMFNEGWIDEVRSLKPEWKEYLKKKKIIGYDDIIKFLDSSEESYEHDFEELIRVIAQKVRNYAKRQSTFFKSLEKKILKAEKDAHIKVAKEIKWINIY